MIKWTAKEKRIREKAHEHIRNIFRKKEITEFERMRDLAELKALSKYSLENPLTDKQYNRLMELKEKIIGV